ncbi:ribonuclease domain-containing protein [Lelliottia sp. V89_10]|uniref:ribonuclease domain-containing protein n=1 Tax=Lelliottia wanjuensis TaxID=3050585 RepID=UPI00249DD113|nr:MULTISPECIES: ribonuclease domain-containing protein [unclassified Lelliottia]MDI3362385.1 ribonuclease domain-containing protein [Lelliottia sp. V89_13]MDK9551358.1 ribonuclease domain-containing protein [Lelliottia sp. V89_5]MDK9596743.1 ribonuclease domain-containing protein [Lelliottia sp. V89_10]
MKPFVLYQTMALMITLAAAFTVNAEPKTCEEEIKETNSFLATQGAAPVNDVANLASTLRFLNSNGRLPDRYITSDEARRLGWSGKDSDTLWGLKPTNGKGIGGDAYTSKMLPSGKSWFSADIDFNRGYRSSKHLVYSNAGQQRFITTDHYQHLVELEPCQ